MTTTKKNSGKSRTSVALSPLREGEVVNNEEGAGLQHGLFNAEFIEKYLYIGIQISIQEKG